MSINITPALIKRAYKKSGLQKLAENWLDKNLKSEIVAACPLSCLVYNLPGGQAILIPEDGSGMEEANIYQFLSKSRYNHSVQYWRNFVTGYDDAASDVERPKNRRKGYRDGWKVGKALWPRTVWGDQDVQEDH